MSNKLTWLYDAVPIKDIVTTRRVIKTTNILESIIRADVHKQYERGYLLEPNQKYLIISGDKALKLVLTYITSETDTDIAVSQDFFVYKMRINKNFINEYGAHIVRQKLKDSNVVNQGIIENIQVPDIDISLQNKELNFFSSVSPESYGSAVDKFLHENNKVLTRMKEYFLSVESMSKALIFGKLINDDNREDIREFKSEYDVGCQKVYKSLSTLIKLSETLSRANITNSESLKITEISLLPFVKAICDLKSVKVKINIRKDIKIKVDEFKFNTLFNNLIENSISHSGLDSSDLRLKISAEIKDGNCEIGYSDNGEGLNISFDKYLRFKEKSKMSKGSGIGGFLIHRIISLHKGFFYYDDSITDGFGIKIIMPHT